MSWLFTSGGQNIGASVILLCSDGWKPQIPEWAKHYLHLFIWLHQFLAAAFRFFIASYGISDCGEWTLAAACGVSSRGTRAELLQGMWDLSFPIKHWTCIPYIAQYILNHWATRAVLALFWKRELSRTDLVPDPRAKGPHGIEEIWKVRETQNLLGKLAIYGVLMI